MQKLLAQFEHAYSPWVLRLLNCELRGGVPEKSNWLLRLLRGSEHAQHPLHHLLLLHFLDRTVEDFSAIPDQLSFFGEGPWPCLNPAATHYKSLVIREHTLSSRLRNNRPVGRFSCECGFTYARSGPDVSPEDRYRIGKMISFGPIWEAKLKGLWKETSLSVSEVGRRLGVDPLTVRRHAARLKLPASRPCRKSKPLNHAARLKNIHASTKKAEKLRTYRARWDSVMRRSPKLTLKALRRKRPREYAWLLQNDPEWLKRHSPRSRRRARPAPGLDWKRRDAEYAVTVRAAAERIRNAPDRTAQVTRTAIGRALGATTLLRLKISNLPLTAQVLAGVVETREQYAVRRVWWAADLYCQEDALPREWQLVMRANV